MGGLDPRGCYLIVVSPELAALVGIVVIELGQLIVLVDARTRSRENERKIDVLLRSLGLDPEDPPTYDGLHPAEPRRTDGGDRGD